jgi:hypothetical protein
MDKITVISSDKDGADLRREQLHRHVRCDGKTDGEQITEVANSLGKRLWTVQAEDWERIFGGRH